MGVSVYPHRCVRYTYAMAKPAGRPSAYTDELATEICTRLASGETLLSIVESDGMPAYSTVMLWVVDNRGPGFSEMYARARTLYLDFEAERLIRIADTPQQGVKTKILADGKTETTIGDMTEHRKLQIDARKWYLSKLAPKRYGDRLELAGDKEAPLHISFRRLDK
jgi:hypothetical protein